MRASGVGHEGARSGARWRRVGVVVCLAWVLGASGAATAAQAVGGVRVVDELDGDGLRLSVRNVNLAAVTLTLTVVGDNAVPDRSMPVVVSCPGQGTFPFVHLDPIRSEESFSYRVRYEWQFGQTGVRHSRRMVYELPYASGAQWEVKQGFGGAFTHSGNNEYAVDFGMPEGTPVHAAREGTVEVVVDRFSQGGLDPALRDQVNLILIRHPDGTYGEYVHLRKEGARVRPGQKVRARELLGYSGNTGYSQGPHLHFAVFRAIDGVRRETFRIRFRAREGKSMEPREGQVLTAP